MECVNCCWLVARESNGSNELDEMLGLELV